MSSRVQRFIVRAHPTDNHPKYYRWQTATLCVFVGDDDKQRAFQAAKKAVANNHWIAVDAYEMATLIEERVQETGGVVWKAYQEALLGRIKLVEIVEQRTTDKESLPPMLAPKVTEAFVDSVVVKAGGKRFVPTGPKNLLPRNADYVIDDHIFDLKILEDESLENTSTQDKLAKIFKAAFPGRTSITIDPTQLPPELRREYFKIVKRRIERLVHSASGQVRETKKQLGNDALRGGVILVNSGLGSLMPSVLEEQAERCVKQSTHIHCVVCLSVWLLTNGFDSVINFKVYPESSTNKTVEKLIKSFSEREEEMMNEWGRDGFPRPSETTDPMKPVAFERDGIVFSFMPPQIPDERFND
ncbi:MAG: hypothetical protein WCS42_25650 [Verrucomicrobiota bacterium]